MPAPVNNMPMQEEAPALSPSDIQSALASIQKWHHSIALGHGITSPGLKTPSLLASEIERMRLPELSGRSVLDIGAWDGFFSLEAERRGARRVVALDHYVWSIDWAASSRSAHDFKARGLPVPRVEDLPEGWDPAGLPGKRGFDLACRAHRSKVEAVVGDFMSMEVAPLGAFDVVFYLGVLYHMRHPLLALERLCQVTDGLAIIETEAIHVEGYSSSSVCEFYETDELAGDPTNWWAPTRQALAKMCRAAGFAHVDILTPPPAPPDGIHHYRLHVHAWKTLQARAPHAKLYANLPAENAPRSPVSFQAGPASPPPPDWQSLSADVSKLADKAAIERSRGNRGLRKLFTNGISKEQSGFNRRLIRVLRALLKMLKGPLAKHLRAQDRRIAEIERRLRDQ
jgi:tRNA (mo5U34)-methyltransferase